jgi:hypothetical protein
MARIGDERSRQRTKQEKNIGKKGFAGAALVVCGTTREYRASVSRIVNSEDVVLEIGSAHGVTTRMIGNKCKRVYGIDRGWHEVADAKKRIQTGRRDNISFHRLDANDLAGISELIGTLCSIDVLFIDIAGTSDLQTLLPLMSKLRQGVRPRVTVIKSLQLKKLQVGMIKGDALMVQAATTKCATPTRGRYLGVLILGAIIVSTYFQRKER